MLFQDWKTLAPINDWRETTWHHRGRGTRGTEALSTWRFKASAWRLGPMTRNMQDARRGSWQRLEQAWPTDTTNMPPVSFVTTGVALGPSGVALERVAWHLNGWYVWQFDNTCTSYCRSKQCNTFCANLYHNTCTILADLGNNTCTHIANLCKLTRTIIAMFCKITRAIITKTKDVRTLAQFLQSVARSLAQSLQNLAR